MNIWIFRRVGGWYANYVIRLISIVFVFWASAILAETADGKSAKTAGVVATPAATKTNSGSDTRNSYSSGDSDYRDHGRLSGTIKNVSRTSIDFNETLIHGKMKAPTGFFIQGRKSQVMSQMVKLRSDFRHKLIQSKYGVKAIVK